MGNKQLHPSGEHLLHCLSAHGVLLSSFSANLQKKGEREREICLRNIRSFDLFGDGFIQSSANGPV